MSEAGLDVRDLTVDYRLPEQTVRGANRVTFSVRPGERLGIVGESGSGKSTTALALIRMVTPPGHIAAGTIRLDGVDLTGLTDREFRAARLKLVSYIPQGAMNSLNPVKTIYSQMADAIVDHDVASASADVQKIVVEALAGVELPPETAKLFPHQLSGGMKQRVCIAIGMMLKPRLIVADEPTSALDVVTQRQVMGTLGRLQKSTGCCLILIGHDMGLMAQFVDKIAIMYAGRIIELGTTEQIFRDPRHPYTRMLIQSVPTLKNRGSMIGLPGTAPSLARLPPGCAFAPRCPSVMDICRAKPPGNFAVDADRVVACYLEEKPHVVPA